MNWERLIVVVQPKKEIVEIIKQTWETKENPYALKNPMSKRRGLKEEIIKTIQLEEPIPIEEYKSEKGIFDSSGLQTDDRFFTFTTTGKRYSVGAMDRIKREIIEKEKINTNPIQL